MKKKIILSIGTLSTLLVAIPVVSCAKLSKNNNSNEMKIAPTKQTSWSDKISTIPPLKPYTWNANNATSIDQMVDSMNEKMHLYLPKTIANLTPYDFANYAFNFFINNGGGTIVLTTEYKSKQENIILQLQKPLIDIIKSFDGSPTDGSPAIDANTQRYTGSVSEGIISIGTKLFNKTPDSIKALTGLWDLFGDYGQEIFGTNSALELLADAISGQNPMLNAFVGLIEPFPASTLSALPIFFGLFKTMAQQMSASALNTQWASDIGVTDQLENVDKIILDKLLHSVNPT